MNANPQTFNPEITICVVGLGYVGLPLAIEFGKRYVTYGYDLSKKKINNYQNSLDETGEVEKELFAQAKHLVFSDDPKVIERADVIIIAVPTPVGVANSPDFGPLISASKTVGAHMKVGSTVVYESTVYPGATEEVCIPILEEYSGKEWGKGFFVGYSPERVNPGDRERTIRDITKVVSGDCPATLTLISGLYGSIIQAGVYEASSIKVAEAAKVIENTQRDLNIALMNELAIIFSKLGIDTLEVLQAAGSKWNFMPFRPGLVGGHCIGVDPYYLAHKAETVGYHPQVILAGRRTNDGMAAFVAQAIIKKMIQVGSGVKDSSVLILGLTFKENCSDIRNSKVADLVGELEEFGCNVLVHDPVADKLSAQKEYGIETLEITQLSNNIDAIILAVPHEDYDDQLIGEILCKIKKGGIFFDVKSRYDSDHPLFSGINFSRL